MEHPIKRPSYDEHIGDLFTEEDNGCMSWALELALVIAAVGVQSFLVFHGYALLFSSQAMTRIYLKLRRWFEGAFAIGFGVASFKILTAKVQSSP